MCMMHVFTTKKLQFASQIIFMNIARKIVFQLTAAALVLLIASNYTSLGNKLITIMLIENNISYRIRNYYLIEILQYKLFL